MLDELTELKERIEKLENFLSQDGGLERAKITLLTLQLHTMKVYCSVLELRCQVEDIIPKELVRFDVAADKLLRKYNDGALSALHDLTPSRERSIAITKLQEATMWLGMDLKRLGTPNPYPESYDATSAVIEPTADGLKM
jgi:hypothetical protein